MPEHVQTYHPGVAKSRRLIALRRSLREISDRKAAGGLDGHEASRMAVAAVIEANGGRPRATSGPMVRLHRLCGNGWIREAAEEIDVIFPDLDHPELWTRVGRDRNGGRGKR